MRIPNRMGISIEVHLRSMFRVFNEMPLIRTQERSLLTGETKTWVNLALDLKRNNKEKDGVGDSDESANGSSNSSHAKHLKEEGWIKAPQHHLDAKAWAEDASFTSKMDPMFLWITKYKQLVHYYNTVGYVRSEIEIARKDPSLMRWVNRQRNLYAREMNRRTAVSKENRNCNQKTEIAYSEIYSQEKIDCLNKVHFPWAYIPDDAKDPDSINFGANRRHMYKLKWLENFKKLEKFKEIHGHCKVTAKIDKDLATWINAQRHALSAYKREGSKKVIRLEEIQMLDSLGVEWGK